MLKAPIKASTTIRLSDTVDQWSRRIHVNVRNGKPTLVYRWRDSKSSKSHTQRMTLSDAQVGRLLAALSVAVGVSTTGNDKRLNAVSDASDSHFNEAVGFKAQ